MYNPQQKQKSQNPVFRDKKTLRKSTKINKFHFFFNPELFGHKTIDKIGFHKYLLNNKRTQMFKKKYYFRTWLFSVLIHPDLNICHHIFSPFCQVHFWKMSKRIYLFCCCWSISLMGGSCRWIGTCPACLETSVLRLFPMAFICLVGSG